MCRRLGHVLVIQPSTDERRQNRIRVIRRIVYSTNLLISIGDHKILPVASARNLGMYFDLGLSMRRLIDVITTRCYATLRQLRAVRRYVSPSVMMSLVLSRLDYLNCVVFGLPASSIRRLQTVQNAATGLVFNIRRSDHVTDALISLHRLRVAERIRFRMAAVTFRLIHGLPPSYTYTGSFRVLGCAQHHRSV
jgi:hypothetical protein